MTDRRPWLRLARLDSPTGIWLLMLPGWQGIALGAAPHRFPDLRLLALFFAGAVLMRSAGCAYNDIIDRDIDAKVARTASRPVASGQISPRAAFGFAVACSIAALAILVCLNPASAVLGAASLAPVAAYPFMKRITWWPQAWLGLTFNWGVILGFCAAQGGPSLIGWIAAGAPAGGFAAFAAAKWPAALLLYASGVAWTLGYDTIYAVQDLEDDALAGVKSSARRLGRAAPWAVAGFYAAAIVLVLAACWMLGFGGVTFWVMFFTYALTLLRQPPRLKLGDPPRALALFRSNTYVAAILFCTLIVGAMSAGMPAPWGTFAGH